MKDAEDEAFDDIARRQGGGFPAKRKAAADKLQEPIYNITVFDNAHPEGIPFEDWVQPAQEPDMQTGIAYQKGFHDGKQAALEQPAQEPERQAMKLALEALEESQTDNDTMEFWDRNERAIAAIKEALAKPAQEPVAHVYLFDHEGRPRIAWDNAKGVQIGDKLYTAPPQRPWVGLTDEEIHGTAGYNETREMYLFAITLIAKLQEKNNG
jgi:hypothetical protein